MSAARSLWERILQSVADAGLTLRENLAAAPIHKLCRELVSVRGEASGSAISREIARRYSALSSEGRVRFFASLLGAEWLADRDEILRLARAYHSDPTADELGKLHRASEPRCLELFRRLNAGPRGTETILRMRRDLLEVLPAHPELEPLNAALLQLLCAWFNAGFLELRRIDWRTPPVILEKLMQYEAVHPILGWPDMRRRLQRDRRCFAFFHHALADEPLIFVQVALTIGVPGAVQPLLDVSKEPLDPALADTAVFFSISNCQEGLRNVAFGAFLLKQVIHELRQERLHVKRFVTLSPVPGFRRWLTKQSPELAAIDPTAALPAEKQALLVACARYLTSTGPGGRALDPVTHFHLSNGASIGRINWMGDASAKGLDQSLGLMVNYFYRMHRIERNHERYVNESYVTISSRVRSLLAEEPVSRGR
jgi:malonyl-CoA decarboxylase